MNSAAITGVHKMVKTYRIVGATLVLIGLSLVYTFSFITPLVPLEAFGLSAIILGLTSVFLAGTLPKILPEACRTIMKTEVDSTNKILEELEIKNKAIYLPRNMRDGFPQALIPLFEGQDIQKLKEKPPWRASGQSAPGPEDVAVAVATQGETSLDILRKEPKPTADGIAQAISYVLNGALNIADRVKVNMMDSKIDIKVTGTSLSFEDNLYYRCLGSPVASIAAAISSEALDKPVRIKEESHYKGTSKIVLEVLS
jgi:hypothetical protein